MTIGTSAGRRQHDRLLLALERLLDVDATDLRSALQGAAQALAELEGAEKADAMLADQAAGLLVALGTSDTPMGRKQIALGLHRLPLGDGGRAVDVYLTGRPLLDGHVERDPGELEGVKRDLGVRSTAAVPLVAGGDRRGVVLLSSARNEAFGEDDLAFLQAVARWIGTMAHRAELRERAERERAERAVAERELERLRDLCQQAPAAVAVVRGPDHVFALANALFRQVVGRDRELDGRPVREALPEVVEQGYLALLDRVYGTGEPVVGREEPVLFDRRGGGVLEEGFFNFVYQPVRGAAGVEGVFVHAVEVTELVRARQAVEALAAERGAILGQMAEAVVIADAEGRITFVNDAARRLHGTAELGVPVEAYSRAYGLFTMAGEPHPPEELPLARAVRRGETVVDALWRVRQPGGAEVVAQGSAAPVYGQGGARIGSVLVARDVTAQHELERQKDAFLAEASHDLKNPLAAVKGVAQLLRRQLARPGGADHARLVAGLGSIETAAAQLTAQIDEMLDATRVRLGRGLELERRPTDLVGLARSAVAAHQAVTDRHHLRLEARVPELVGSWDADRLQRVLDNLLANAVKYSPEGGDVVVTVDREEDEQGRVWAVLAVRDRGLGIPAADLPRLFAPYQRGGNVPASVAGTGLGLASAREIAAQHGGRLEVESEEGRGSTFTMRLPIG